MTVMLGPTPCQGCREPVVWRGKHWRNPGQRMGAHKCSTRVRCGALMAHGERCHRWSGHLYEHRTAYSLDNARRARRSGLAA